MKLDDILYQIDSSGIALPEFQRGYVWNRDQVRGLMYSLYRKYPIGSLLVWVTPVDGATPSLKMLLDGQQRITSLYGVIKGSPPGFFHGNANAFTGLHFHLDTQVFEFYSKAKMQGDPLWVNVTALMQEDVGPTVVKLTGSPQINSYVNRLTALTAIKQLDFHVEEVVGADKTLDVVVDIFNRVNSGGTKLSQGDLALAKVCAQWPVARKRLRNLLDEWDKVGFSFKVDWLLRVVTTILTGKADLSALEREKVSPVDFEAGLERTAGAVNYLLNLLSARLGIDHDRVLNGKYAFAVMARYLTERRGKLPDATEQAKLLYWYVHSFCWGRYSGSTETMLNQDLAALERGGLDELIEVLRRSRGDLVIRPSDFSGYAIGARFYPLLHVLTRVYGARDLAWGGLELSKTILGKGSGLQVHHIFPKAVLYKAGYKQGDVNAIANYCFLTQSANLQISDHQPAQYFADSEDQYPGALGSQWIPTEVSLRSVGRYPEFLEARRGLLAKAANAFLDGLLAGPSSMSVEVPSTMPTHVVGDLLETDLDEGGVLADIDVLVDAYGIADPVKTYLVEHPQSGEPVGIADMAWPEGLQAGYGEPVALVLDGPSTDLDAMQAVGYRVFKTSASLRHFLEERSKALVGSP